MTAVHLEAAHVHAPGIMTPEASTLGPGTAFGIIAGGIIGLISGLAQYNSMYTGARFVLPMEFVVGGAVLGTAILGVVGWVIDKLIARQKAH